MKISYVIIVLNGMPFIEFSMKACYPTAHEIIIVEGAVEKCKFAANEDGSSNDGTVEFIKAFPDPGNKIKLIQGIWPEKCEMQVEALNHVTGDWVWLVDSDEVYYKDSFEKIIDMIENDNSITQVNFFNYSFWKGFDYYFTNDAFRTDAWTKRRLFKFVPGATFSSHRPPTIEYPEGVVESRHIVTGAETEAMGIRFCHYSYVFKSQMKQKIELYHRYGWGKCWKVDLLDWYENCFLKWTPENIDEMNEKYGICPVFQDTIAVPFEGKHPEVIHNFIEQVRRGEVLDSR